MSFAYLNQPSVFLASPSDLAPLRRRFLPMFDQIVQDAAQHHQLNGFIWEESISASGWDHTRPAQEQLPLPSDHNCKAVVCFFSERIGTPMRNPELYLPHLGDVRKLTSPDGKLVIDWDAATEEEKKVGFALTGTVFEVLVALAANDENGRPEKQHPPLRVWFLGEDSIWDQPPGEAVWGHGRLRKEIDAETDLVKKIQRLQDYVSQVTQLHNFMHYLRGRIAVDKASVVPNVDVALEQCKSFLIQRLDLASRGPDVNPFKGLHAYDVDDDRIFFGRDAWLGTEIDHFSRTWLPGSVPFFGLYGGSGTGKSSLLRAGMLARLARSQASHGLTSYKCLCVISSDLMMLTTGEDLFRSAPLYRLVGAILAGLDSKPSLVLPNHECSCALAMELVTQALDQVQKAQNRSEGSIRLVVGLDQFEELLDYREERKHRTHLDELFRFIEQACASGRVGFIFTLQTNRKRKLEEDAHLQEIVSKGKLREVTPLSADAVIEIAEHNFDSAGMKLSKAVVGKLREQVENFVQHASESRENLLPLFSLTLDRLFQYAQALRLGTAAEWLKQNGLLKSEEEAPASAAAARPSPQRGSGIFELLLEDVPEDLLQVENAINAQANRAFEEAMEFLSSDEDVLYTMLRRMVRIEGGDRLSLPAIRIPPKGFMRVLIGKFLEARLMLPVKSDEVRLIHEAVIRNWSKGEAWFRQEQELLSASRTLTVLAEEWRGGGPLDLSKEHGEMAGKLLLDWMEVFQPTDGTSASVSDSRLKEFCLAYLAKRNDAKLTVVTDRSSCNHLLLATYYGALPTLDRYLREPKAKELVKRSLTKRKSNAVYAAVCAESLETVRMVLSAGADPKHANIDRWQPVHVAAYRGRPELFDLLVNWHGVDPFAPGPGGTTAIHLAAVQGEANMVRHLLQEYAFDPMQVNESGESALGAACKVGESEVVRLLLQDKRTHLRITSSDGWSPFHIACRHADSSTVRLLLNDPRTDFAETMNGITPLQLAIFQKSPRVIRTLLTEEKIARIPLGAQPPLHLAKTNADSSCVEALLSDPYRQIDVDESVNGETLLASLCSRPVLKQEDLKLVQLLLSHGASVNQRERHTLSAGLAAAKAGNKEALRLLIGNMDPAVKDREGRAAVHLAAQEGHVECLAMLLERFGRQEIQRADNAGNLPQHLAQEHGHREVIQLLRKRPAGRLEPKASPETETNEDFDVNAKDSSGSTILHHAASKGDLAIIKDMLDDGSAPELRDKKERTPLLRALEAGQGEAAQMLIGRGVQLAVVDDDGWTPLHFAVEKDLEVIYRLLLEPSRELDVNARNNAGETPLHRAASANHTAAIDALLDAGAALEVRDDTGKTPLLAAIPGGNRRAFDLLLARGASLRARANGDASALHLACESDADELVQSILNSEEIPVDSVTAELATPLHLATKGTKDAILQALLRSGASLEARDGAGRTPLLLMLGQTRALSAELLIEHGARLDVQDNEGTSALHLAIRGNLQSVYERILNTIDVDLNARMSDGTTPLHLAAATGNLELIEHLVKCGAALELTSKAGRTPFLAAVANGRSQAAELLLASGARLEARDLNDWSALHFAVEKNAEPILFRALSSKHIDVNARTSEGFAPLHLAVRRGDQKMTSVLLQVSEADPNIADKDGRTALHYSVLNRYESICRFLIDSGGVNVLAQSATGRNALHFAAQVNSLALCRLLLETPEIDKSTTTNARKTARDLAAQAGHTAVVELLDNWSNAR